MSIYHFCDFRKSRSCNPASTTSEASCDSVLIALLLFKESTKLLVVTVNASSSSSLKSSILNVSGLNFKQTQLVLKAAHPSPLGAHHSAPVPFIGCGHFETANKHLEQHCKEKIVWNGI